MKPLKTVKLVNRVLPCTLACVAVGDEESDPALMEFLGAGMKKESGQFFKVDTISEEEEREEEENIDFFVVSRSGRRLCCPARCLTSWSSKDSRLSPKLDFLIFTFFLLLRQSVIGWISSAESYASFLKILLCSGCPDNCLKCCIGCPDSQSIA